MIFRNRKLTSTFHLLVAAVLWLHHAAPAQVVAPPAVPSCVWQVQSQTNTVYLLGSIHLLKKQNYPLPAAMEAAFDDAQIVVFEVDPDSLFAPGAQQAILQRGMYAPGQSLQASLSAETYQMAGAKLAELGLAIEMFNGFEPWVLALALTAGKLQKLGLDPRYGVDFHFSGKAKQAGKQMRSLETLAYQISRFDGLPPAGQEALLQQTLKDWEVIEKELRDMVRLWATGEVDSLAQMMFESYQEFPQLYEILLGERNRNWLPKLEAFLKEDKNILVVVGAGHLIGKDSVIQMLQNKGYAVRQL